MKARPRLILCVLFAILASAGAASARTIHVNAGYTGTFMDGSEAFPYKTLSAGNLAAAAGGSWETGDVVLVHPGRYYGNFRPRNYVTIQGTDPARVIISDPMFTAPADAPFVRISKVTLYDDCHTAFTISRYGLAPGTWYFDECTFEEVRRGVDVRGNASLVMTRCVFFGGDYDYSVMQENGTGTISLYHCVFASPRSSAVRINNSPGGRIDVVNSIVSNAYRAVDAISYGWPNNTDYGRLVSVRYSDLYNSGLSQTVVRERLINADPMFQRPYAYPYLAKPDYRLNAMSPCIDTGLYIGLPFLGNAPDMGAYESSDVPPTLPEALEDLAQSYSDLTAADLETPAEQRRNAFLNKMEAIDRQYDDIKSGVLKPVALRREYQDMRDKVTGDLMAKCDAHVGGNPDNDWITDPGERQSIYDLLSLTVALLDREIAALP